MSTQTDKLIVLWEARLSQFEREMKRGQTSSRRAFNAVESDARGFRSRLERTLGAPLKGGLLGLGKTGFAALGLGAGLSVGALGGFVRGTIAGAAAIKDLGDRTGFTTDAIQELRFAFNQAGADIDTVDTALEAFSKRVGDAANGTGELHEVLTRYGVSVRDANGNMRSQVEILGLVADVMKRAGNESLQLDIAAAAFGRGGGAQMVVALQNGKQALDAGRQAARDAGAVMRKDLIETAAEVDDAFQALTLTIGTWFKSEIIDTVKHIQNFIKEWKIVLGLMEDTEELALQKQLNEVYEERAKLAARIKELEGTEVPGEWSPLPGLKTQFEELTEKADELLSKIIEVQGAAAAPIILPEIVNGPPPPLPRRNPMYDLTDPWVGPGGGGAAGATGFGDAAVKAYVDRVVAAESGGRASAKNPNSSATGLGQFIASTWLDLFKRHFPDRAKGMADATILALRKDAEISRQLIEAYATENADVLRRAGVAVTEASLHLSHFLGAGDAAKVFNAPGGTPLKGLISSASISANPTILGGGRTVDDAIAYANRRANTTRVRAGDLNAYEEATTFLKEEAAAADQAAAALGRSTYETVKAATAQRLMNAALEAGLDITPELTAEIDAQAEAEGRRAAAVEASQVRIESMQEAMAELGDIAGDALKGFINDLIEGKTAAEALGGVLQKIGTKLLDKGIDMLLNAVLGGGGGGIGSGQLLGSLFGGGRASGGPVTPGRFYRVHKDEWIVPRTPGTVVPVSRAGGLSGGPGGVAVQIMLEDRMLDARIVQVSGPVAADVTRRGFAEAQDRNRRAG